MEELVVNFLHAIHPLSAPLVSELRELLKQVSLQKKELFLRAGETSNRISFIIKGLLRSYYINKDGEEVTSWFMKEGDVTISVKRFYQQVPSE